jgi:hypothetical protein
MKVNNFVFTIKVFLSHLIFWSLSFSTKLYADTQNVFVVNSPKGYLGNTVNIEVGYETSNSDNTLSGIGLRLHFDSSLLTFVRAENTLSNDLIANASGPVFDENNLDNDENTDSYITFGWASLDGNWPNKSLPSKLFDAIFEVSNSVDATQISSTNINFTSTSTSVGYDFQAGNYQLKLVKASWDFDENGHADALSDGLLLLRHTFGMTDENLTNDAISEDSPLTSEEVIQSLHNSLIIADIDGDGNVDALTDALLLLRYLFEVRGDDLISEVIPENASRTDSSEIEYYIDSHMPGALNNPDQNPNPSDELVLYENIIGNWFPWNSYEEYEQSINSNTFLRVIFNRTGQALTHLQYMDPQSGYIFTRFCMGHYTANEVSLSSTLSCRDDDGQSFQTTMDGVIYPVDDDTDAIVLTSRAFGTVHSDISSVSLFKDRLFPPYFPTNVKPGFYGTNSIEGDSILEISNSGEINSLVGCDISGYILQDPVYGMPVAENNTNPELDIHSAILDISGCNHSYYSSVDMNGLSQSTAFLSYSDGQNDYINFVLPGNENGINHTGLLYEFISSTDPSEPFEPSEPSEPSAPSAPSYDGVPPYLNEVTVVNQCNHSQYVAPGNTISVTIDASESILRPIVYVAGHKVLMSGQHHSWSGEFVFEDPGYYQNGGEIPLSITYTDNSGMSGEEVYVPDHGPLVFCDPEVTNCQCFPEDISGVWQNANKTFSMGVGPVEGSMEYWAVNNFELARRDCLFDDTYTFAADENIHSGGGHFSQDMGGWTWLEFWASPDGAESCGDPRYLENYPWDGLEAGLSYEWNPDQAELTLFGEGAHIGLPRIINGGEASNQGPASSITYSVESANNCFMSFNILAGGELWWHFELERLSFPDPENPAQQLYIQDYPEFCNSGISGIDNIIPSSDQIGPDISISGPNPLIIMPGDTYSVPAATFVDAYDSYNNHAPTGQIQISGDTVDITQFGTYTVTYSASDNAGNVTTKDLIVIVEPTYLDEVVVFRAGDFGPDFDGGANAYDQANNWGTCATSAGCPSISFELVDDTSDEARSDKVLEISHVDDDNQAGVFIESSNTFDLRGAYELGKLVFDVWSENGVSINVMAGCVFPCESALVTIPDVGKGVWETVTIPITQLLNDKLTEVTLDKVNTVMLHATSQRNVSFRVDNIRWECVTTCEDEGSTAEGEVGGAASFTGVFDGFLADAETNTFEWPTDAASWAGVANENLALYPIVVPENTQINFLASSAEPVSVYFRLEYKPYPVVNPLYETDSVVVNGDCQAYSINLPSQGSNTFESYLLFIEERDIPVTVSNVVIGGEVPSCDSTLDLL